MDTWKAFLERFKSPVVVATVIIMLLNTLRIGLGWQIELNVWEMIINLLIYVVGGTFAATNNPTTLDRF
jgi:hypothetical protein